MKLSEAQARALLVVAASSGKSTNFYRDFGVRVTTLESIEDRGLVEGRVQAGWAGGVRQWFITDAGRSAATELL